MHSPDVIYYGDHPSKMIFPDALKGMNGGFEEIRKKGVDFTRKERKFLKRKLPKLIDSGVPDQLFPESRRLGSDTICDFLSKKYREGYELLKSKGDTIDIRKKLGRFWSWAYFIAEPIYIRGKTIRVSYFAYFLHDSGESVIDIEILKGGIWRRIGVLSGVAY